MQQLVFLRATLSDIPELLAMMGEFNAGADYPFNPELAAANLQAFILDLRLGALWTIQAGTVTIGYLILAFGFSFEHGGRDAFIDELFLKKEFRQVGLGKQTLEFVERQAKVLNVNVIHLEVERSNTDAAKLYRNKGFTDNGRILLSKRVK